MNDFVMISGIDGEAIIRISDIINVTALVYNCQYQFTVLTKQQTFRVNEYTYKHLRDILLGIEEEEE